MQETVTQYDLHVHNIRHRLVDVDGMSVKTVLDAIVGDERTVFVDDSARYIRKITFSQERGDPEKTILTFKRVKHDDHDDDRRVEPFSESSAKAAIARVGESGGFCNLGNGSGDEIYP